MASKIQKPCRVCGKMFYPCVDCAKDKTMFHWRAVACSLECAKAYFAKVEEARKPVVKIEEPIIVEKTEEIEKTSSPEDINGEEVSKPKRIRKQNDFENEKESE